jgi:hypothetical protein
LSPPHSHENPPRHSVERGEERAKEIGGDDFMFADDMFPSLSEFSCLSSLSSVTYLSPSSSNAYTNAARAGGVEPASNGEGFDALKDIDEIFNFVSLFVPSEYLYPMFPDMSMMIEDAMSAPPHSVCVWGGGGANDRGSGKSISAEYTFTA